ncbi:MAG: bifunctional 4-hydroxy-2-oxoglutarate aldolase/2-dehydro-3-deoxy-phosphogluconate aldolase [Propionibacteriaceae bacterium]|nr:bifunctional 4-hydroxy-2-oxoglutarate aldolase/2-dehydro-3-deoxy-phosphogluconate aldolase [Propionibacteriaceae bacterium]
MTISFVPYRSIAILRGHSTLDAIAVAKECWQCGFDLVEVTVQSDTDWVTLEELVAKAGERPVGAGTVLTADQAKRAASSGARVFISPSYNAEVHNVAIASGIDYLPGVLTPTEIAEAMNCGISTLKLFPARAMGAKYIADLLGPFPDLKAVAVGGIDETNYAEYLDAGAAGVAFGGSLKRVLAQNPHKTLADIASRCATSDLNT